MYARAFLLRLNSGERVSADHIVLAYCPCLDVKPIWLDATVHLDLFWIKSYHLGQYNTLLLNSLENCFE